MEFTPEQKYSLLSKMGYTGPVDSTQMENFISSNPGAAAKMGKFQRALTRGFEGGGRVQNPWSQLTQNTTTASTTPTTPEETTTEEATPEIPIPDFISPEVQKLQEQFGITPELLAQEKGKVDAAKSTLDAAQKAADEWAKYPGHPSQVKAQEELDAAQEAFDKANKVYQSLTDPKALSSIMQADLASKAITDPSVLIKTPEVVKAEAEEISEDIGKLGDVPKIEAETIEAETVSAPEEIKAETIEAGKVTPLIEKELENLQAVKGMVSKEGTVRGQLELLMQDFEGGGTPPWASGAMRKAMGLMEQRGLGASSIAGQAIVQAAMESAISIAVEDASTVAEFEMANLNREQETVIFKTQQKIAGLLQDVKEENAAKQFNALSKNQTKQFMAEIVQRAAEFNVNQINAIRQFNAGEKNAVERFNTEVQAQREQFNASNSLIIAQSNANWRQQTSLADTAAQNEANRVYTQSVNNLTAVSLDNYWQEQRDKMSFAFQESENEKTRAANLAIAQLQANSNAQMAMMELKAADKAALGSLAATALFGTGSSGGFQGILSSIF